MMTPEDSGCSDFIFLPNRASPDLPIRISSSKVNQGFPPPPRKHLHNARQTGGKLNNEQPAFGLKIVEWPKGIVWLIFSALFHYYLFTQLSSLSDCFKFKREHTVLVTFLSQKDLGFFVLNSNIVLPDVTYFCQMGRLIDAFRTGGLCRRQCKWKGKYAACLNR